MKVDKLQQNLVAATEKLKENLDQDAFHTWKSLEVTKLFFTDLQVLIIDKMKDISNNQPIDDQAALTQANDRGYYDCLNVLAEWNPFEEDEDE